MSLRYIKLVTTRLGIRYKWNEKFFYTKPRTKKEFTIRECNVSEWQKFRKYHYLNTEIHKSAKCYGLYDKETIIGFIGILHFPCVNKKIKSVSRLVILPDYQGIGLGTKFLNIISDFYINNGYDFKIQTSAKNLINSLKNNEKWCLVRYGKVIPYKSRTIISRITKIVQ